jgi:hypothetical protein
MSLGLTIAIVCVFLFFIALFWVTGLAQCAAMDPPTISDAGSDVAGEVSVFSSQQSGNHLSDTPPLSSASIAPALDEERTLI